jgi:two-component system sensor histidine kinase RegB
MSDIASDLVPGSVRGNWIRLRTLILLRWLAIFGQIASVLFAVFWLEIDLPLPWVVAAILASFAFNVIASMTNPRSTRVRERTAAVALLFDVTQLNVLLFLTGGLSNPFCFLILAPITISATALSLPITIMLVLITLTMVSALGFYNLPLTLTTGEILAPPAIFIFGTWVSLVVGCVFVAAYARRVTVEIYSMSQGLAATQLALSREQKLTDLGGVVAAAAHELGTPLATIKLVSSELEEELSGDPELVEDVRLINAQAERCRDILHNMGRAGRDDLLLRFAPVLAVIEEAAEPHMDRGKAVSMSINGQSVHAVTQRQPQVQRKPEIIHGLRNLVQNAVDFATKEVWIDVSWDDENLTILLGDDGIGFPAELMDRIGEPFVKERSTLGVERMQRPGYEGMGLGLFIAKTLLERSGATITFLNAEQPGTERSMPVFGDGSTQPTGAIVILRWRRSDLEISEEETRRALGPNALNIP